MGKPSAALSFFRSFIQDPVSVGAFCPSSAALSRRIVDSCDFSSSSTVVELGPGTGAFTTSILERLSTGSRFIAVEIDPRSISLLRRRRLTGCEIIHGSAEDLPRFLNGNHADCIISGLAWGNMSPQTQNRLMDVIQCSLAPGGQFVAFAYLHARWLPSSRHFRRRLARSFNCVESSPVVWRNLPPAYVYRCRLSHTAA
ncbi:MAG: methyltransferase domain-containing protein [Opitutaceae bacterium]|nr:methyltransferase domain-containing protein [Opitutaceae bacterium]